MFRDKNIRTAVLVLSLVVIGFSLWWFSNRVEGFQNAGATNPDLAGITLPTTDVVGKGFLVYASMNEITSKMPFFITTFSNVYDIQAQNIAWTPAAVPNDTTIKIYFLERKDEFTLTPAQLSDLIVTIRELSRQYFNREDAISLVTKDEQIFPRINTGSAGAPADTGAAPMEDTGAAPMEDTGAAPMEDAGAAPMEDTGAAPMEDTGAAPMEDTAATSVA